MPHRLTVALVALLTVMPAASFAQAPAPSPSSEGTTAVITGQGVVSRPPDLATLTASIQSNDDVAATATAQNNATLAALTSSLGALRVDASDVKTTFYNVTFNPRPPVMPSPLPSPQTAVVRPYPYPYPYPTAPRYGYLVNRQVSIALSRIADVGAAVDAAVKVGVTNVNGVQYGLRDRKSANEAALALALEDAAGQARIVATASHMHLGGIKTIQVGQPYAGGVVPMPMTRVMSPDGTAGVPTQITPAAVDVRATVTVTYYLKP